LLGFDVALEIALYFFTGEVVLILVVDTAGILHILDEYGAEILRKNLNVFHKKQILLTDVEAHSGQCYIIYALYALCHCFGLSNIILPALN
jgi:hypothetical protein